MPVHISAATLARMRTQAGSLAKRAGALRDRAESSVKRLVCTAEVSAASFGFGIAKGRYGAVDVAGIPADLGTALLLHVGGFMKLAGKSSHHLHGFADGALASYLTDLGKGVGISMKQKALGAAVTGAQGHRLTEAQLAALAR
jgi:hypothetical protein